MSENLTEGTSDLINDAPETDALETSDENGTTEATAAKTWQDRLGEVTDGSRVADLAAVTTFVASLTAAAQAVVGIAGRLTEAIKVVARETAYVRPMFLTADGNPDWAGSTMAYRAVAEATVAEVFGEIEDKKTRSNLTSSIRQHVNRTYRDLAMIAYVAAMTTDGGDPLFEGIVDESGAVNPEHAGYEVFRYRIRAQYLAAGLKVPSQWQTAADRENGGGGGSGADAGGGDAMTLLSKGLDVVKAGGVADDYAAAFLLQGLSAYVLEIANPRRDGGITNREVVEDFLLRASEVSAAGAKACASVLTAADRESLAAALWSDEDAAKLSR